MRIALFSFVNVLRILLQDEVNGLYLEELGRWTADPAKGLAFQSPVAAALFTSTNGLKGVKLIVHDSATGTEIPMPADMSDLPN